MNHSLLKGPGSSLSVINTPVLAWQALESVVRKKKQIVVSEGELRQQQARASPVPPSLLQRMVVSVRRGGSSGAHGTAQLIASLKEEV